MRIPWRFLSRGKASIVVKPKGSVFELSTVGVLVHPWHGLPHLWRVLALLILHNLSAVSRRSHDHPHVHLKCSAVRRYSQYTDLKHQICGTNWSVDDGVVGRTETQRWTMDVRLLGAPLVVNPPVSLPLSPLLLLLHVGDAGVLQDMLKLCSWNRNRRGFGHCARQTCTSTFRVRSLCVGRPASIQISAVHCLLTC